MEKRDLWNNELNATSVKPINQMNQNLVEELREYFLCDPKQHVCCCNGTRRPRVSHLALEILRAGQPYPRMHAPPRLSELTFPSR